LSSCFPFSFSSFTRSRSRSLPVSRSVHSHSCARTAELSRSQPSYRSFPSLCVGVVSCQRNRRVVRRTGEERHRLASRSRYWNRWLPRSLRRYVMPALLGVLWCSAEHVLPFTSMFPFHSLLLVYSRSVCCSSPAMHLLIAHLLLQCVITSICPLLCVCVCVCVVCVCVCVCVFWIRHLLRPHHWSTLDGPNQPQDHP
jgi:hypothetical protein